MKRLAFSFFCFAVFGNAVACSSDAKVSFYDCKKEENLRMAENELVVAVDSCLKKKGLTAGSEKALKECCIKKIGAEVAEKMNCKIKIDG